MEERFYLLSLKGADGQGEDFWLASILKGLDQERRNRVQSIKNPRKRLESAGAGLLLQLALQEALLSKREEETVSSLTLQELLGRAGEPLPLHFAYGVQGKPYVTNYPYFFSLSHSGDYVLCAFSQREIGADIQQERDCPVERLAERFFSQEERRRFAGYASERAKKNYFYECWCRREAYGKLKGEGVGKNLGSCIDDKAHWIMVPSPEGYRAAACMRLCEKEK